MCIRDSNKYDINANSRRGELGFNAGITVGFNIFDGNRRREKRNASLALKPSSPLLLFALMSYLLNVYPYPVFNLRYG